MSETFDLMQDALNLAETAKDAMRTNLVDEPDDTTWGIAANVLKRAKELFPSDPIIQPIHLNTKLWVSLRSAMEAVANRLKTKGEGERNRELLAINRRRLAQLS